MRRVVVIVALFSALLIWGAAAVAIARTPLPAEPGGRSVHDLAGVIEPADESTMERTHTALFEATEVAIVVVTVAALEDETIDEFALRVGETWGVGAKDSERGIVVALSAGERRIFVATGYGVEGYLPDGKVGRFIDTYAIPHLRDNDFSTALLKLSTALVSASAEEFNVTLDSLPPLDQRPPPTSGERGPKDLILGILGAVLFVYLAIRHPRLLLLLLITSGRGGRGGGGFGSGGGFGGFGGGGFGGGGAGRGF